MRFWIDDEGVNRGGLPVNVLRAGSGGGASDDGAERGEWLEAELTGCSFPDVRLDHRLRKLLEGMAGAMGESRTACQAFANTKAAYRFLDNDRVSEDVILDGHCRATRSLRAAQRGSGRRSRTRPFCGSQDFIGLKRRFWSIRRPATRGPSGQGQADRRGTSIDKNTWRALPSSLKRVKKSLITCCRRRSGSTPKPASRCSQHPHCSQHPRCQI